MIEEIAAKELNSLLESGSDVQLIDVRQPEEYAFAHIPGARLVPLGDVVREAGSIDPERETVVYCRSGVRSAGAIAALQRSGFPGRIRNLKGGILAWSDDVDPSVPKY